MPHEIQVADTIWDWVYHTISLTNLKEDMRAKFELWKSGAKKPTFSQLEKFSRQTHIPLGYFFLSVPPDEDYKILEFRTAKSKEINMPSRDLIDTINQMQNIQDWMKNDIIETGKNIVPFVGSFKDSDNIKFLADNVRSTLSVPLNWFETIKQEEPFKYFKNKISDIGVMVMVNGVVKSNSHRPLNINEFRGFALTDNCAPLIFINGADNPDAKLFTLLHELMHIGYGTNSLYNDEFKNMRLRNKCESNCNAITAEILVPDSYFTKYWERNNNDLKTKLKEIAKALKCSMSVIAIKACSKGLITKKELNYFNSMATVSNKNKAGGGDLYRTLAARFDRNFLLALNSSVEEGKTLYTDAYELTNTNRKTFDGLINKVRGV